PSAVATDGSVTEDLAEIRASVEALAKRPSLAEDRETVVLAVRQLLGETVSATVGQSERNVREHINAAFGQALPASEGRVRARGGAGRRGAGPAGPDEPDEPPGAPPAEPNEPVAQAAAGGDEAAGEPAEDGEDTPRKRGWWRSGE